MVWKLKKLTQKGFTLLEMLIVLFIISLLLLLFIPNIGRHQKEAKNKGDAALQQVLQTQVELYEIEKNEPPTSFGDLDEYLTPKQMDEAGKNFNLSNGIVSRKDGE